jgi:tetratricopeptide (TPR) repeat protein
MLRVPWVTLVYLLCSFLKAEAQRERPGDPHVLHLKDSSERQKTDAFVVLCYRSMDAHPQQALCYADSALQIASKRGDSSQIVFTGRLKGQLLLRLDELEESLILLHRILPIAKRRGLTKDYKRILNALAIGYSFEANYDEALKYHFESLVMHETEGDKAEASNALNHIGFVYFKMYNYEQALEYYNKSLDIKKEVDDKNDLDLLFINIGLCLDQLGDCKEGLKYINDALKMCEGNCSPFMDMEGKFGVGVSLQGLGRLRESEDYFVKSYTLAKELKDKRFQIENLIFLARVNGRLHRDQRTIGFLKEAEAQASGTSYNQMLIEIYREFFFTYNQSRDFDKAAAYEIKYIQLNDSIQKGQWSNISKIQTEYEEWKNLKTITSQGQILLLKENVINDQRVLNFLIGIVAILFLVLAIILYTINRHRRRINILLDQKVKDRTQSLAESLDHVRRSHAEQNEFLRKASRDIENQLATLKGLLNVMLTEVNDPTSMNKSIEHLKQTANNLFDIGTRLKEK